MSRNIIWFFLLIVLYQGTNAKLCEIKKWYKDLQKKDFIVSNLNPEQEELIEKIEKKIRNSKFSGTSKVNCDILDEYELILSTDANRHKRKAPTKLKTFEKDTRDNVKYMRKSNDNEDEEDFPKRKYKKYTSSKKEKNDEDNDAKKNDKNDQALKQNDENSEIQSKNENIKKNGQTSEPAEIDEEKEYDPTESDVDETELLEEELPSSTEHVKDESIGKNIDDKESSEQMTDEEVASHQQAGHNATKDTSSVRFINLNQVCSKHTTKCSRLCYYGYQNQQSLIHYPGLYSQNKTQNHLQLENPMHVNEKSDRESPTEGSDNDIKAVKPSENESNDDTIDDENSGTGTTDKQPKVNSTDGNRQDLGGTTDKQPQVSANADKQPEFNDNDKQQRDQETTEEKDTIGLHKEDDNQKRNKPDSGDANDKETQRDSKMNSSDQPNFILSNIDILLQQRATEYSTKISQLEILLMKLENKFLNQQLHKQNDSNSFSKLEFQIVKLENELLKLNQSYYKLSSENEVLRSLERQRSKSYAALPEGNSTKHKELITQQQVKISQLTDWLTNQTTNLNQLQDKSDSLAAQNQALYQIVMNQTALISNIMQKVQDLSEENLSYRKETQDLKSKINSHDASVKILEKLDSLGSKRDVTDVNQKQKTKQFHFLPDAPEASINRHLWKCNGLLSPQICYMYSILLSPCPPFSTVYWRKCPTYISEKTASFFVEYLKKFPNGTEASKDKLIQNPADPNVRSGKEQSIPKQETINDQTKEFKDSKDIKLNAIKEDEKKRKEEVENKEGKKEERKDEEDKKVEKSEQVLVKDDENEDDKDDTGRPIKYKSSSLKKPKDCYEVYQRGSQRNGVYKIFLPGLKYYVDVYCDMKNGGWTLIQKRLNGDIDFFKDWKAYKEGFGVNTGEHYLGNDFIHFLTNQGHYSLHVELVNWKKEKRQATYKDFWIDDEDDGYKLHIEGYGGDAGDGLSKHNEMKFSTHDVDNDLVIKQFGGSCAKRFHGAGWYYKCYSSNLNGQYYDNGVVPPKKFDGVAWKPWTGPNYSLKEIVLKVRPKDVL